MRVARRILSRGGFSAADLACGAHPPMHEPSALALARSGKRPTALHNNCSGKHGGLLLACRLRGFDPHGYENPSHPIGLEVLGQLSAACGVPASDIGIAVDGCSLPVFFLPLSGLAFGYARLVSRRLAGETPELALEDAGVSPEETVRYEIVAVRRGFLKGVTASSRRVVRGAATAGRVQQAVVGCRWKD